MDAGVVQVPFTTQLLAATVALQALAFGFLFWRAIWANPERFRQRPRWPFIPLVLGTAAGVWYAVIQRDLVMGVAQAVALFIGFRLILGTGAAPAQAPQGTRKERREAGRAAQKAAKAARRGGGNA